MKYINKKLSIEKIKVENIAKNLVHLHTAILIKDLKII